MLDLLTITVILPLLGAGGVLLIALLFSKLGIKDASLYVLATALAITLPTGALILASGGEEPVTVVLSSWQPLPLFGSGLRFGTNIVLQPLGLILVIATGSVVLAELARVEETPLSLIATSLALLAAGLAALWSANPLTTIVSWAFYDLIRTVGHVAAGGGKRDALQGLVFGTTATLFLWGGVLAAQGGMGSVQWSLMPPGGTKMALWTLAGVLRLSLYPFHLSTPSELASPSPLATLLLLNPIVGWGLWIQLASVNGGPLPMDLAIVILSMITVALGGFLSWSAKSPRRSLAWIGMTVNGMVLLAAGLISLADGERIAQESALSIMALGSMAWMLDMTILSLGGGLNLGEGRQQDLWLRGIPSVVGVLALIGAPFTLGFVTEVILMTELTPLSRWGGRVIFFFGHLFLIAASIRWILPLAPAEKKRIGTARAALLGGALIGPAFLLLAMGVQPGLLVRGPSALSPRSLLALPDWGDWLLWSGTLVGGGLLAWQDRRLRPRTELWLSALHDLTRLDWLYGLLVGAFEQGFALLRAIDEVLGGTAALLWSWILFLIALLVWRIR